MAVLLKGRCDFGHYMSRGRCFFAADVDLSSGLPDAALAETWCCARPRGTLLLPRRHSLSCLRLTDEALA